jgi:SNF family Na+-dependent transporter
LVLTRDEFNWNQVKELGRLITDLIMGLLTVIFINKVLDEYDYWVGTVSLVAFAMLETIFFSFNFIGEKALGEITSGADIQVLTYWQHIKSPC